MAMINSSDQKAAIKVLAVKVWIKNKIFVSCIRVTGKIAAEGATLEANTSVVG